MFSKMIDKLTTKTTYTKTGAVHRLITTKRGKVVKVESLHGHGRAAWVYNVTTPNGETKVEIIGDGPGARMLMKWHGVKGA